MRIPDGHSISHLAPTDRRQEFVAVLESVIPQTVTRLESLTLYFVVVAFWGLIIYVALTTFASQ